MAVVLQAIIPTKITTRTFNAYMLNALKKSGKEMQEDFEKTVATWQTHHPEFKVTMRYSGGAAWVRVSTDDEIYAYIDKGTSVRRAAMTKNFVPKTSVGWIGSAPGAGQMAFVSKKLSLPGIQAREFTITIEQKHWPLFDQYVNDAIQKAFAAPAGAIRP